MGMGVNVLGGVESAGTMGFCLRAELGLMPCRFLASFLPTGQTRMVSLKTVGQVRRSRTPLCVSWGERVSTSTPLSPLPAALGRREASSAREPGILMSYPAHPCPPPPRPQSMLGAHWEAGGAGGMWVALW